jgi:hypothetical protein
MTQASSAATAPSETSPLIPKPSRRHSSQTPIDPSARPAPDGPDSHIDQDDSLDGGIDGGDLERQASNEDSSKRQGLPDVKKKMKWIFPAVAIGIFLAAADQTLVVSTYGTIGTDLKALNNTSWIATAYVDYRIPFFPSNFLPVKMMHSQ